MRCARHSARRTRAGRRSMDLRTARFSRRSICARWTTASSLSTSRRMPIGCSARSTSPAAISFAPSASSAAMAVPPGFSSSFIISLSIWCRGDCCSKTSNACRQLMAGEPVALPATTASFKEWAERLERTRAAGRIHRRARVLDVGRAARHSGAADRFSGGRGDDGFGDERAHGVRPRIDTGVVARSAQSSQHANWRRVSRCPGQDVPRVDRRAPAPRGHRGLGREPIFDEVDTSRTVGWFTSVYPVLAEWTPGCDAATALATASDRRRAVPSHGLSYGALRYLRSASPEWSVLSRAEVCFLYLGNRGTPRPTPPCSKRPPNRRVASPPRACRCRIG